MTTDEQKHANATNKVINDIVRNLLNERRQLLAAAKAVRPYMSELTENGANGRKGECRAYQKLLKAIELAEHTEAL